MIIACIALGGLFHFRETLPLLWWWCTLHLKCIVQINYLMSSSPLKMMNEDSMLSLIHGLGYSRQVHCISPVSVGGELGRIKQLRVWKKQRWNSYFSMNLNFSLPTTFDDMCLTAKHRRNVFKIISRKYLQGQSNVKLISLIPSLNVQWILVLHNNVCKKTKTSYQRKSVCRILLQLNVG